MACLKVFLGCALFLAGSLGESWYPVLEALQNADSVLSLMAKSSGPQSTKKGLFGGGPVGPGPSLGTGGGHSSSRSVSLSLSGSQSSSGNAPVVRHPLLSDLDVETMQLAVQRLFDSSKNLEDTAFRDFVNALCKLSAEMVGMQTTEVVPVNVSDSGEDNGGLLTINKSQESMANRRRVSGIYIPKNVVRQFFFLRMESRRLTPTFFFLSEVRRLWHLEVRRGCNVEHSSTHLSLP